MDELMKSNAALAAELRSLILECAEAPRSVSTTTSSGFAAILDERQTLLAQIEAGSAEVEQSKAAQDDLEQRNRRQAAEMVRLRSGLAGFGRHARGRLLGG